MKKILTAIVCTAVLFAGLNASTASASQSFKEYYYSKTGTLTITIDGKPYLFDGRKDHYFDYFNGHLYTQLTNVSVFTKSSKQNVTDKSRIITSKTGKTIHVKYGMGVDGGGTFSVVNGVETKISEFGAVNNGWLPVKEIIDNQGVYDYKDDGNGNVTLTTKKK